ncbi:MAG: hypothetical protein QXK76_00520 [Candidatus Woesearchaeota archaeon]
MKFLKKSQAAIEFMVTYGWVIIAVMLVLGALAYYGVFNFNKYINDECSFGSQIYCEDFMLQSDGTLSLRLRNNFGQEIMLSNIGYFHSNNYVEVVDNLGNMGIGIPPGSYLEFELKPVNEYSFNKNDKVKLKVVANYVRSQGSSQVPGAPYHNITGIVVATVQ